MITNIDHIGIAVSSLDEAMIIWRDIVGLQLVGTDEVESQKVKVAMFKAGESNIELLESTDPEGPIGKFVEKNGGGIHHIALRTDDIEISLMHAREAGAKLLNEKPVPGAHDTLVAFLHPKSTGKVLVEFCQHREKED